MPIVLCQVFPSSESKKRPSDKIQEINNRVKAVRGDAQVTVLDTWTLFANDKGDAKLEEMPDLLHLNDGVTQMKGAIRPVLATPIQGHRA